MSHAAAEPTPVDITATEVSITAADLPLSCPRPGAAFSARHPKVYLDALKTGEVACPYCGTKYVFTGERPKGHH